MQWSESRPVGDPEVIELLQLKAAGVITIEEVRRALPDRIREACGFPEGE